MARSSNVISAFTGPLHARLPLELISRIFTSFCEGQGPRSRILLLTVCREWQAICYSTPALWSEVKISLHPGRILKSGIEPAPGSTETSPVDIANRAKDWLSRSGALPCSLDIHIYPWGPAQFSEGVPVFEDLIMSVSSRLKRLALTAPASEVGVLRKLLPEGLRQLEKLSLSVTGVGNVDAWTATLADATFSQCTKLRTVAVTINCDEGGSDGVLLINNPTSFLPWRQLTTLNYQDRDIPMATFAQVFSLCTSLKICDLRVCFWPEETPLPDVPPTTFPDLRVLKMTFSGYHIASFLQLFRMPALTELEFTGEKPFTEEPLCAPLLELYQRSPFPLRRLSFAFVVIEMEVLLELLPQLEHLEEFWAEGCNCLDEAFIQALIVEPNSTKPILPRFKQLDIQDHWSNPGAAKDDSIIRMIKSRWFQQDNAVGVTRIENVSLSDEYTMDEEYYLEVMTMVEEGLRLCVRGIYDSEVKRQKALYILEQTVYGSGTDSEI